MVVREFGASFAHTIPVPRQLSTSCWGNGTLWLSTVA
jgi:hypothetical protein